MDTFIKRIPVSGKVALILGIILFLLLGTASLTYADRTTTVTTSTTGADYPFTVTGNATSTLTQFNGGLTAYASSTIGNGFDGLTVSGNSTTTGNIITGTGSTLWTVGPNSALSNAYAITSAGMTYPAFDVSTTGNVGIGDVAPSVPLSVIDTCGFVSCASNTAFAVASSSLGVSTTTLLKITTTGALTLTGNSSGITYNLPAFGDIVVCGPSAQTGGAQFLCNFNGASQGTGGGGNAINWSTWRFNGANNKIFIGDDSAEAHIQSPHSLFLTANSGAPNASSTPSLAMLLSGINGFGTSTPLANLQVTNPTANATTSTSFGKKGQTKGWCGTYYDDGGNALYAHIVSGATSITYTTTKPSGCTD